MILGWLYATSQFVAYSRFMPADVQLVPCQIQTFKHRLKKDFDATWQHMQGRKGKGGVFSDMDKLKWLAEKVAILEKPVYMVDSYCLQYRISPATSDFSCKWEYLVEHYSMREYLSFKMALNNSILKHNGVQDSIKTCYVAMGKVWYVGRFFAFRMRQLSPLVQIC